jgi:hypothetical protein
MRDSLNTCTGFHVPGATVGEFRSGCLVRHRPAPLTNWRVTTACKSVAARVAELLGGSAALDRSHDGERYAVATESDSALVLVAGISEVTFRMRQWGLNGVVHECDGSVFMTPDDLFGTPCGCPRLLSERKARAKEGEGPSPSITVTFRHADDPELGVFRFQSASWRLAAAIPGIIERLRAAGRTALCELVLRRVEVTTRGGSSLCYSAPVLNVVGPVLN